MKIQSRILTLVAALLTATFLASTAWAKCENEPNTGLPMDEAGQVCDPTGQHAPVNVPSTFINAFTPHEAQVLSPEVAAAKDSILEKNKEMGTPSNEACADALVSTCKSDPKKCLEIQNKTTKAFQEWSAKVDSEKLKSRDPNLVPDCKDMGNGTYDLLTCSDYISDDKKKQLVSNLKDTLEISHVAPEDLRACLNSVYQQHWSSYTDSSITDALGAVFGKPSRVATSTAVVGR